MLKPAITLEQVMHQWARSSNPSIVPKLKKGRLRKWIMTLEEVWPDDLINNSSGQLDIRVNWTEVTLLNWKTVHRLSWDSWQFDSKFEAEKFITIYRLTWE